MKSRLTTGPATLAIVLAIGGSCAARDLETISILTPDPDQTQSIRVLAAPPAVSVPADTLRDIMDDGSLQPGDVVMFTDGPRVFLRSRGFPPWSEDDFADVASSGALTETQRRAILALTLPSNRLRVTIGHAQ